MPTDQTIEYLAERGFSRGDQKINRPALADACIAQMLERMVDSTEQLQQKGLASDELRELVLGIPDDDDVETELDGLIASLTGPKGPVQKRLSDGVVLCSARVKRQISGNGNGEEPATVSRMVRFLSDNDDIVEAFFIAPGHEGLVKKGEDVTDRWDIAVSRRPALAARRHDLISKTQQRLQLAMEIGA